MKLIRQVAILYLLTVFLPVVFQARQITDGAIRGVVTDANGGVVGGATITVINTDTNAGRTVQTNREGAFSAGDLPAGKYTVRAAADGFAIYENQDEITAGKTVTLDVSLSITVNEEVMVGDEQVIATDSEANASAIVLKQEDIKALPDDPAELEAALQALAGPVAGPGGEEVLIDGFSGGRLIVFVNIEDKSEVVRFDSRDLAVKNRRSIAPGEEASGVAIDRKNRRLFIVCGNQKMIVMNSENGKVVADLPIGDGADAAAFDAGDNLAFSSSGEGALTVVREDSENKFSVVENIPTQRGARTMTLDAKTHKIYLPKPLIVC